MFIELYNGGLCDLHGSRSVPVRGLDSKCELHASSKHNSQQYKRHPSERSGKRVASQYKLQSARVLFHFASNNVGLQPSDVRVVQNRRVEKSVGV